MTGLTFIPGVPAPAYRPLSESSGGAPPAMTLLALTATQLVQGGGTPFNLTAALAASPLGSNTGITFPNTGRETVYVQTNATSGGTTVTSDIGTTVQGQAVPGIQVTQAPSLIQRYGPYPSQYDAPGGANTVEIDFGTPANVSGVVVVRQGGVV